MSVPGCDLADISCSLQAGLLALSAALVLAALVSGGVRPRVRPWAFAVGLLAGTHALYYALFLLFPDVLDGRETLLFSVMLRYQVLFTAALVLLIALARGRVWKRP